MGADYDAQLAQQELGLALRRLRQDQGMLLKDVAAASGLAIGYISDVERGRSLPRLDTLHAWTAALGVSVAGLLSDLYPWGTDGRPELTGPPPDGRFRASRKSDPSAKSSRPEQHC